MTTPDPLDPVDEMRAVLRETLTANALELVGAATHGVPVISERSLDELARGLLARHVSEPSRASGVRGPEDAGPLRGTPDEACIGDPEHQYHSHDDEPDPDEPAAHQPDPVRVANESGYVRGWDAAMRVAADTEPAHPSPADAPTAAPQSLRDAARAVVDDWFGTYDADVRQRAATENMAVLRAALDDPPSGTDVEEQPCPDCDDSGYTVVADPRDPTGMTPEQVQCPGPKHRAAVDAPAPAPHRRPVHPPGRGLVSGPAYLGNPHDDPIWQELSDELDRAMSKHAPMHSPHEGWAVIREELDPELWKHVVGNTGRSAEARKEAMQIAAMGLRYVLDLCDQP